RGAEVVEGERAVADEIAFSYHLVTPQVDGTRHYAARIRRVAVLQLHAEVNRSADRERACGIRNALQTLEGACRKTEVCFCHRPDCVGNDEEVKPAELADVVLGN